MSKLILAIDQGTTSSRCILFNKECQIVAIEQKEITQIYPKLGWVEHNPNEILSSQLEVCQKAIKTANINPEDIEAIGITNQRETTILWDKKTGKPIYNAIVWQCRRTSNYCNELKKSGYDKEIKEKTGLILDSYFSATKIKWILDNVDGAKEKALKGDLLFGTVDTFLLWNLTKGKVHATDFSNASRTLLFNIHSLCWDEDILKKFDIPKSILPKVYPTSYIFGVTDKDIFGSEIRIGGIAGDQQASLFGQRCFYEGMVKNTYGTGCFTLMNTGNKIPISTNGLLTTIAWKINNSITYALEGSVFSAGATIQWLRDELKIIDSAEISEYYASKVSDTNGVYFVPAFVGLGAPYWDQYASGTIIGISRGTKKDHIIRAALESMAYQSYDVINAMEIDSSIKLNSLRVDGGASANNFLMQFQSDILNIKIFRPSVIESTALGAAFFAGLATGYFESIDSIFNSSVKGTYYIPDMKIKMRNKLLAKWRKAVSRSLAWYEK